jgi:hypothetical protein
MRALLFLIGLILIALGAVYLMIPADQLPAWLPGYEAGRAATRMKHGLAAGGIGIVVFIIGLIMGRRS